MHITGALLAVLLPGGVMAAGLSSGSAFSPDPICHIPLTDRQKEILRKQDLPEVYEELTPEQRGMILMIEELLCEVEEKYGKELLFECWEPETEDDPGSVSVWFRDPDWDEDIPDAVVTRREDGGLVTISDNFALPEALEMASEAVERAAGEAEKRFLVFVPTMH